jgi:hypothetical protein
MTLRERLPNRREHVLVNFTTADGFGYTAGFGYFDDLPKFSSTLRRSAPPSKPPPAILRERGRRLIGSFATREA